MQTRYGTTESVIPTEKDIRAWLSTKGLAMWGQAFLTDKRGLENASMWLHKNLAEFYAWKENH
jgi:hypothetical protein